LVPTEGKREETGRIKPGRFLLEVLQNLELELEDLANNSDYTTAGTTGTTQYAHRQPGRS
jgi:hypothetical protein